MHLSPGKDLSNTVSRPIILITAGRLNRSPAANEVQIHATACNLNYIEAVSRGGGAPILLPRMDDKEAVGAIVSAVHGVLLTGGGDVVSLNYGEEPHRAASYQDPVRDEMEMEVVSIALKLGVPILGICRGIQILNVALGGTLIQDIPSQVQGSHQHYTHGHAPVLSHSLLVEHDSVLASVLGTTELPVNTYHHQAVKDLGKGLRVCARARDGVIEAIESSEGKPILAVQYHPEEWAERDVRFQVLFDWLVHQARDRH